MEPVIIDDGFLFRNAADGDRLRLSSERIVVDLKPRAGDVFAHKMDQDGMSLTRAQDWLKALLFDNPNRVYKLGLEFLR